MLIVYQSASSFSEAEIRGKQEDTLALTWEQRRWVRGRFTTRRGREIALALPLVPGAIIHVEAEWYVRVEAIPEPLLAIKPDGPRESVRLAFEIGNRHFPLAFDGETILVPDDPAMTQLFDRLRIRWQRLEAIFAPIGNGLARGG